MLRLLVRYWFLLALLCVIFLAGVYPQAGGPDSILVPSISVKASIFLIFLIAGMSMHGELLITAFKDARSHLWIQANSFVIYPLVGLGFAYVLDLFIPEFPFYEGLIFACCVPITISTAMVYTHRAGGDTALSMVNSVLSNFLGIFITPMLVLVLLNLGGQVVSISAVFIKLCLLVVLPFILGQALRWCCANWLDQQQRWLGVISNSIVLFPVFLAFCGVFLEKGGSSNTVGFFVYALVSVIILWVIVSCFTKKLGDFLWQDRNKKIAFYFCGTHKSLAAGVSMGGLMFEGSAQISTVLLPVILLYPVQMLAGGVVVDRSKSIW